MQGNDCPEENFPGIKNIILNTKFNLTLTICVTSYKLQSHTEGPLPEFSGAQHMVETHYRGHEDAQGDTQLVERATQPA